MRYWLSGFKRALILALVATLFVACASYMFFNVVHQLGTIPSDAPGFSELNMPCAAASTTPTQAASATRVFSTTVSSPPTMIASATTRSITPTQTLTATTHAISDTLTLSATPRLLTTPTSRSSPLPSPTPCPTVVSTPTIRSSMPTTAPSATAVRTTTPVISPTLVRMVTLTPTVPLFVNAPPSAWRWAYPIPSKSPAPWLSIPSGWVRHDFPVGNAWISFGHPSNWHIEEYRCESDAPLGTCIPLSIHDFTMPRAITRTGTFWIDIHLVTERPLELPGRTHVVIGPQQLPALQLVTEFYPPYPIPDNIYENVRTIDIHLSRLEIFARYWPPKDTADRNTELFYQMLKTFRWDQ